MSREVLGTLPDAAVGEPLQDDGSQDNGSHSGPSARRRRHGLSLLRLPVLRLPLHGLASRLPLRSLASRLARPSPSHPLSSSHALPAGVPEVPRVRSRQALALTVTLTVAVGLGAGWAADTTWRSARSTDARLRTAGLSVVVVDTQHTGDAATKLTADLTVRLGNLGLVPVRLIGSGVTYDAAAIVWIEPPQVTVPVDGTRTAVLQVSVDCRSPQPLELPPLQGRAPDGSLISVAADGAGQALADLCDAGTHVDHLVRLVGVSRDGDLLKVSLTAAGGRTTELHEIRAGGVHLDARPLPAAVDGETRTVWLQPPPDCALTWQRTGLPESVQLDVDVGADATVTVPLGYALPAWLLDGPCRGSPS
jgi:hypothetical protein